MPEGRFVTVTRGELENWLRAYGEAWTSRDPNKVSVLFSEDASYRVTPFTRPAVGRDEIRAYWADATANHREVRFRFEILSIQDEVSIIHWSTAYSRASGGERAALDGIFVLRFTEQALCEELHEWWHQHAPSEQSEDR